MKTIAIVNQKGGVAKTTTAINLSAGLVKQGNRALLVDFDPQGNSTLGLGINIEPGERTIYNALINSHAEMSSDEPISSIVRPTYLSGLDIAPANIHLDKAELQLAPVHYREMRLKKLLDNLKNYNFVVIDTRPTMGILTINALFAADYIIVPIKPGRFALDGFADLLATVESVKSVSEFDMNRHLRLLITQYDASTSIVNEWVADELKDYQHLMFNTKIRKNTDIEQSQIAGEAIFDYSARSHAAIDYKNFTNEFLNYVQ